MAIYNWFNALWEMTEWSDKITAGCKNINTGMCPVAVHHVQFFGWLTAKPLGIPSPSIFGEIVLNNLA